MGEEEIENFMAFLEEAKERLEEKKKEEILKDLISAHYGCTEKQFSEMIGKAVAAIHSSKLKTDAIDECFPKLKAEQRLMVWAFHCAYLYLKKGD